MIQLDGRRDLFSGYERSDLGDRIEILWNGLVIGDGDGVLAFEVEDNIDQPCRIDISGIDPGIDRSAVPRSSRRLAPRAEGDDVTEVGLNPVIAASDGSLAVDALVVLADG